MPTQQAFASIESFKRAARLHIGGTLLVCFGSVILGILGFGLAITHRDTIRAWYFHHFAASTAEILFAITPWIPTLIWLVAGLFFVEWKYGRDPNVRCPHCRKQLISTRSIVIATRNCPHCGSRVIADPP